MKKQLRLVITSSLMMLFAIQTHCQVGINNDAAAPDNSAMLDVKSTNKGFLPPRMSSTDVSAIPSPVEGLMVYNTTVGKFVFFNGASWKFMDNTDFWVCGLPMIDVRDGKSYTTVLIGTQCWMSQNLNHGIKIDRPLQQTQNGVIEKYCYDNLESNCDIYGGMYQWDEVMQYVTTSGTQGICPTGWHIPTDVQWTTLTTYLGGELISGGKMKSTGTLQASTGLWFEPNTGATNSSGFTGLPGGYALGGPSVVYELITSTGIFWSSSQIDAIDAWYRRLRYAYEETFRYPGTKTSGVSCRCLQD